MNEGETIQMHMPRPSREGTWRWLVGLLLGALVATWLGNFTPNRNIVTVDQLHETIQPLQNQIAEETTQIQALRDKVNDLRGELKGKHLVSGNP